MPKAVGHTTYSWLLEKSRQQLVKLAEQVGRYAFAKQFKRMMKTLRSLKTYVGRAHREFSRQLDCVAPLVRDRAADLLACAGQILTQQTKDKHKLYALACARARMHQQGQGENAVRVRREGQHCDDV